jgi:SAM-dependent methyltransferase
LITVSVQYLTRPVEVFREVARVLRPGGVLLVSFSNRMFATKAVRVWQETPEEARPGLVARYLALAGGSTEPVVEAYHPPRRWFGGGDPLWAVVARRA